MPAVDADATDSDSQRMETKAVKAGLGGRCTRDRIGFTISPMLEITGNKFQFGSYCPGPKLEKPGTKFHWGTFCTPGGNNNLPQYIEANGQPLTFEVGDVMGSMFLPEFDQYWMVYNEKGEKTNCKLKLYGDMNDEYSGARYNLTTYLKKENEAVCNAEVPNLTILKTGPVCEKLATNSRYCSGMSSTDIATLYQVYFECNTAASLGEFNSTGDAAAIAPGTEQQATPSSPSSSSDSAVPVAASFATRTLASVFVASICWMSAMFFSLR
jgi:hypothetical protein